VLSTNRNTMVAIAKVAAAMLGTATIVNGLACTPTSPASMQVQVAPGEIYSLANLDGTAYGSLAADTTHQILKQGILLDAAMLSCPAPTTNGFSVNYLIEATYQDVDSNALVLPYYNASNPSQAFSGAGNNGAAQNTTRDGVCSLQVKAGIAAATGTQVTPSADSGYVGLWVVTVAYGQTTITSANIAQAVNAPFLPAGGLVPAIQGSALTFAPDTGAANVYKAQYNPPITTLTDGLILSFKAKNANSGSSTFSPNGLSASSIYGGGHAALQGGEIVANGLVEVEWNSSLNGWVLLTCTGGSVQVPNATQLQHALAMGQVGSRVGEVSYFAMSSTPSGWLQANGSAISRTAYAALFSAIGTTYGAGDGSTTFNIPDLRGEFIRGFDNGRGVDSGRVIGSWQAADNAPHTHEVQQPQTGLSVMLMGNGASGDGSNYSFNDSLSDASASVNNRLIAKQQGVEGRPRNIALLVCIKY
jgi:microcystin-dependent protein